MDFTAVEMLRSLSIAFLCGMIPPIFFDFISVALEKFGIGKAKVILFIRDVLFILVFTLLFVLLLYYIADGKIRGVFLISLLLGSICYYRLLSNTVKRIMGFIILPIRIVIGFIAKNIKKAMSFFIKGIAKKLSKMYNKYERDAL